MKHETVKDYKTHNKMLVDNIRQTIADKDQSSHRLASRIYRHEHLAYCMLRGTPYENIETKVREGNEPNMNIVNAIISENEHLRHVPREKQIPAIDPS